MSVINQGPPALKKEHHNWKIITNNLFIKTSSLAYSIEIITNEHVLKSLTTEFVEEVLTWKTRSIVGRHVIPRRKFPQSVMQYRRKIENG